MILNALILAAIIFPANASPSLPASSVVLCQEVGGSRHYRIEVTSMQYSGAYGEASVVAASPSGPLRQYVGRNARLTDGSNNVVYLELRAGGRLVESLQFWDSVVFREVDGKLDYQNGNRAALRCRSEK